MQLHADDLNTEPPVPYALFLPTYGAPVPGDIGSWQVDSDEEIRKYRTRQRYDWDTQPEEQVRACARG